MSWDVIGLSVSAASGVLGLVLIASAIRDHRRLRIPMDRRKLRDLAAAHWGIRGPIFILWAKSLGDGTAGTYRCFPRPWGAPIHFIEILGQRPLPEVLNTLAHELTHAAQAERVGYRVTSRRQFADRKTDYWSRPVEVEARRVAADLRHVLWSACDPEAA